MYLYAVFVLFWQLLKEPQLKCILHDLLIDTDFFFNYYRLFENWLNGSQQYVSLEKYVLVRNVRQITFLYIDFNHLCGN